MGRSVVALSPKVYAAGQPVRTFHVRPREYIKFISALQYGFQPFHFNAHGMLGQRGDFKLP